jgi:hypothetical protein
MRIFGISITIGGEADTNEKLDRYNELSAKSGTETFEEWADASPERLDLYVELREKGIIEIVYEPEPKGFWGKLFS